MRYLAYLACLLLVYCSGSEADPKQAVRTDFQVLTKGEVLTLEDHVQTGKFTVFDFYADWCPPCKALDSSLIDLKKVYGDRMVVYKLDIVNWESELAKQHKIKDLPYLIVFDDNGQPMKGGAGPSNQVLPALIGNLNRGS